MKDQDKKIKEIEKELKELKKKAKRQRWWNLFLVWRD